MAKHHRLYWIRDELGLSIVQLSRKAGVSVRTIQNIENSRGWKPRMETRRKLMLALNLDHRAHRNVFGPMRGDR